MSTKKVWKKGWGPSRKPAEGLLTLIQMVGRDEAKRMTHKATWYRLVKVLKDAGRWPLDKAECSSVSICRGNTADPDEKLSLSTVRFGSIVPEVPKGVEYRLLVLCPGNTADPDSQSSQSQVGGGPLRCAAPPPSFPAKAVIRNAPEPGGLRGGRAPADRPKRPPTARRPTGGATAPTPPEAGQGGQP